MQSYRCKHVTAGEPVAIRASLPAEQSFNLRFEQWGEDITAEFCADCGKLAKFDRAQRLGFSVATVSPTEPRS